MLTLRHISCPVSHTRRTNWISLHGVTWNDKDNHNYTYIPFDEWHILQFFESWLTLTTSVQLPKGASHLWLSFLQVRSLAACTYGEAAVTQWVSDHVSIMAHGSRIFTICCCLAERAARARITSTVWCGRYLVTDWQLLVSMFKAIWRKIDCRTLAPGKIISVYSVKICPLPDRCHLSVHFHLQ